MQSDTPWPELDDIDGRVAGILVEGGAGGYQGRVHLSVKSADREGGGVRVVGPTFRGRTWGEAFEDAESWVADYLRGAYGVTFRARRLEGVAAGPVCPTRTLSAAA